MQSPRGNRARNRKPWGLFGHKKSTENNGSVGRAQKLRHNLTVVSEPSTGKIGESAQEDEVAGRNQPLRRLHGIDGAPLRIKRIMANATNSGAGLAAAAVWATLKALMR